MASNGNALQNMAWDDGVGLFSLGPSTVEQSNADIFISMLPSVTDVSIIPGFGVVLGDSLPAFYIGNLAPRGAVSTHIDFLLTKDINTYFFNGNFVRAIPEPATLALVNLGLIGIGFVRRLAR